ncbi:MAG: SpoIIE family protein phosphatase [Myxococcota bacterium]
MLSSPSIVVHEQVKSTLDSVGPLWEGLERRLFAYYGAGLDDDFLMELRLAFTEGVVNAIRHAHQQDGRIFDVEVVFDVGTIDIRVVDTGPGFEWPEELPDPLAMLDGESGRGVFLIRSLVNEASYVKEEGRNVLTMRKSVIRPKTAVPVSNHEDTQRTRKVLVADDDADIRLLMRHLLQKSGCEVIEAQDGVEALELMRETPDLDAILLDVMMPKLDGLDVLRAYRSENTDRFVPVVLVTAKAGSDEVAEGFEAGADEYVVKPPHAHELRARLRAALRLHDMAEKLRKNAELLTEQLRDARRLQNAVLPPARTELDGVEFHSLFRPADFVGGDMVGYFRLDEDHVGAYVADVSGHGVAAAMFSMWLNQSLHPVSDFNGIVKRRTNEEPFYQIATPGEVCSSVDRIMETNQGDDYLTMFYSVLNTKDGTLQYSCAGHPGPFVMRQDGRIERLQSTAGPVGFGLGFEFGTESVVLEPGDRLLAYSDCALEAMSAEREEFGDERLESLLANTRELGAGDQLQRILEALREFRGGAAFEDDLTLLSVQRKGEP